LARFRPLLYTGDLSLREREAVLQEFRSHPAHVILVLSLRAGGQGLNLQQASYVFHFDRWWNPAVERQAEARSHRLGQALPVNVYTYTCEGTIEERIDGLLRDKQVLFDELVDGVSLDLRAALSGEDLFGLFGLDAPARDPGGGVPLAPILSPSPRPAPGAGEAEPRPGGGGGEGEQGGEGRARGP
jgi:hypothetical protein